MTAVSPTTAAFSPARPLTADIDASTRGPILLMAFHSVLWLIVASAAAFIASLKLHVPALLAGMAPFTYGRLVAAADAVFIFGFASQAAMAVALWLICRLGATRLIGRGAAAIGALFWNLGVLVGFGAILGGALSPYEHLQFPQYAFAVLLFAFLLYGTSALLTFANRAERTLYPSLWFVLAGITFFPWTLATVMMTLSTTAVRSSATPIIAAWAANNIVTIWLGSIALAAIYYVIPKSTGRPLYSHALAVFSFWLFVIFGQSTGMHYIAAIPAWVQGLSEVASLLIVLPIAAAFTNWHQTRGTEKTEGTAFSFARWAARFLLVFALVAAITSMAPIRNALQFTLFQTGLKQLFLLGFVTLALFGAFAYILPVAKTSRHFTFTFIGSILVFAFLMIGGIIQGSKAANASTEYLSVVKAAVGPVGIAMLGYLLIIVGQLAFLGNLGRQVCAACCGTKGGAR